ncbi:MAG TPA: aconitase X catalytic domain-containing protein [Methanomassiliicoccales archaeon]|nr:aconitase X catalytic domain-containing protein [Methanomassiliicoccales archaeon]
MQLTRDEESILAGDEGEGRRKALELLVAVGEIYGAERLIPISSAHLSGVSYKTIGDGGLEFIRDMAKDAKVAVLTTLNPAGMDRTRWSEMGVDAKFAEKQNEIIEAYASLGVTTGCTCTPYITGNSPSRGEHIAGAESSALSYANSVLDARTNREGGPGALAAAIIGKTPEYGLHMDENRKATVIIEVEEGLEPWDLSLLGHAVGAKVGSAIPFFKGIRPDSNGLKSMAAAMAASGSVAMFHVEGITPAAKGQSLGGLEKVVIGRKEIERSRECLLSGSSPDLIAIGCPHLSQMEMKNLASFLDGKRKRTDTEVWFCTSRTVKTWCPKESAVLERFGKVLCDTCMIVAPIESRHRCTATDSAKACAYLPGLCGQQVICGSWKSLLEGVL